MELAWTCILICCYLIDKADKASSSNESWEEDQRTIKETIAKYGFPENPNAVGLPELQFAANREKSLHSNVFIMDEPGTYIVKIRTVTEFFSYNGHYEEGRVKKTENEEVPVVRGFFGEHFSRKNGGHYIRTLGYTVDESGYRQFLIELSFAQIAVRDDGDDAQLIQLVWKS